MGGWHDHDGSEMPVPIGTLVDIRYRGTGPRCLTGIALNRIAGVPMGPEEVWATNWQWTDDDSDIIAYRIHDDGQSETETRQARIDQFYKIAAGKDHLIEETFKTRKPVSAPQKAGE